MGLCGRIANRPASAALPTTRIATVRLRAMELNAISRRLNQGDPSLGMQKANNTARKVADASIANREIEVGEGAIQIKLVQTRATAGAIS